MGERLHSEAWSLPSFATADDTLRPYMVSMILLSTKDLILNSDSFSLIKRSSAE